MESSKLICLLKTFNEQEWKAFHSFLKSAYHNRRSKLVVFYELLYKISKTWSPKKLLKTNVYTKIYPGEAYTERRLVEMRSTLVKLIEQFWELNHPNLPNESNVKLALAYHKKKLFNYRDVYFEKSLKNLRQEHFEATEYHKHLLNYHLTQHNLIEAEEKRNQEPKLQAVHDNLDTFYLCSKLKYYCKILNYQNFRSHQYDIAMMDMVLEEAAKDKYKVYPSIQIYYNGVFTLLDTKNEHNFYALKKLLMQNTKTFSVEELQNIFILARNFCAKNFNMGKRKFIKDALDLYKVEIKEGLILEDDKMSDSSCRNIIKLSLLAQDIEWASQFLEKFKPKISTDIYTFSLANLYFHQQKYKAVLDILLSISFKEILLELAKRALILKTYFQQCRTTNDFIYEDTLEAYLNSFKAFLNRKEEVLKKHYLLMYQNFVKFIQAINKLYWKPKLDETKLADLHQKILKTPETVEWDWLKEISKVNT